MSRKNDIHHEGTKEGKRIYQMQDSSSIRVLEIASFQRA